MSALLKDRYNYQMLHNLALNIKIVYPLFKIDDFLNAILDKTWAQLPLKARIRKIASNLEKYLPPAYEQALAIIDKIIARYPAQFNDFTLMYFPEFVAIYGQNICHWELSMTALARYTQLSSSEFAVRPFIINQENRMMQQMIVWAKDDNEHVRRLASEGCRPQLPWGQSLISFYVRKSVANNLNDISKTHPELVIKIAKQWYGVNNATNWIVKHGCRTLLKMANHEVMAIFGLTNVNCLQVTDFSLDNKAIIIGEVVLFRFKIMTRQTVKVRLEYAIDYVKANGKRKQKIFQISQIYLKQNMAKYYQKKHSFANLSTRKHYPGTHAITLIVNGKKWDTLSFMLSAVKP